MNKKLFIPYICAGYPDLKMTEELIKLCEKLKLDIIEIGVPFSDPVADGKTIQYASEISLKNNTDLDTIFNLLEKIKPDLSVYIMSYFNPIMIYSEDKFLKKCKEVNIKGVIIPDLPFDQGGEFYKKCRDNNIKAVNFITPVTQAKRIKRIISATTGFLYLISVTGVTGVKKKFDLYLQEKMKLIKSLTDKKLILGFGVKDLNSVKKYLKLIDGVIIGSRIIDIIRQENNRKKSLNKIEQLIKEFIESKEFK